MAIRYLGVSGFRRPVDAFRFWFDVVKSDVVKSDKHGGDKHESGKRESGKRDREAESRMPASLPLPQIVHNSAHK